METAIYIKDKNIYEVKLSSVYVYKIGDKVISEPKEKLYLTKEELNNIRLVKRTTLISYYLQDNIKFSIEEYNNILFNLQKEGGYREGYDYDCGTWQDIDKEYEYKKFKASCQPVYEDIEIISDPISIEIKNEVVFDTGNEYIRAKHFLNGNETDLYFYNREKAIQDIIHKTFQELGYKYVYDIDNHDTKNIKLYGFDSKYGIDFMVAWGHYITPEKYKTIYNLTTTLDEALKLYEEDIEFWKDYITKNDKKYFIKVDLSEYKLDNLIKNVESIENKLAEYKFKKSYYTDYSIIVSNLKKVKDELYKILSLQNNKN